MSLTGSVSGPCKGSVGGLRRSEGDDGRRSLLLLLLYKGSVGGLCKGLLGEAVLLLLLLYKAEGGLARVGGLRRSEGEGGLSGFAGAMYRRGCLGCSGSSSSSASSSSS